MRIQYAEPVKLTAAAGHTEFDAYGRRFSLDLEGNDRLVRALPASTRSHFTRAQPLRGKLDGHRGSWVRLTQVGAGLEGAIWDGQDLYVVTALSGIQKHLTTAIDGLPAQTVVYRLSDTLDSLPEGFCGLTGDFDDAASPGVSALERYRSLVEHLAKAAAMTPAEELSLALIADTSFQQQNGNSSADAMLARLNIVDGIFADQIGVLLQPTEFRLLPANDDPFTATDPNRLLDQLSNYRSATPVVRAAGLAHLVSGRNLDGDIVGIAYRDSLCDPTFGASLTGGGLGPFFSALVMAHELGHNFGAQHDGAPGGACATTPSGYLMSPQVNGSSVFSACSRDTIAQSVARARGICIAPARYADVAVSAPANLDASANVVFPLPVTVRSIGNIAAVNATIRISLPSTISFHGAALPDGACSTAGNEVACQLGDIPAGSDRTIELNLMSSQLWGSSVTVTVGASNDYLTDNGSARTDLIFRSAIDLALAMLVPLEPLYANDNVDITLDVTSTRALTASGGILNVTLSGLEFDSATAGPHACAVTLSSSVRCELADIPSGATSRIVLHTHGVRRGGHIVSAYVQINDDGNSGNNTASATVQIMAENDFLISASADSLRFEPETVQEVTYALSAVGRVPSRGAHLRVWAPGNGVFDSFTASSGTCSLSSFRSLIECQFGDLAPGDTRAVTVRFHATSRGGGTLIGEALHYTGPNTVWINTARTSIYSNLSIDVIARTLSQTGVEGVPGGGVASVESVGLQPAQNVLATLEFPPEVQLTSMSVTNSTLWTCELLTPQRGRCMGAFTANGSVSISYGFSSNAPGSYTASLTVSADGDADAANDVSESTLLIEPYLDVGVITSETQMHLVGGQDRVFVFFVTTGPRPVPGVVVRASREPSFEVASIAATGHACIVDPFDGYGHCDLGDLPANANVPVSVAYRVTHDGGGGTATVGASTSVGDHNHTNNIVRLPYTTIGYTDVRVEVSQTTATTVSGSRLTFPRITVSNTGTFNARAPMLQIPLPAFASVDVLSGAGFYCSGTSTLSCEFFSLAPGATFMIDLSLHTSGTGQFTSTVTLQSGNDPNPGNNSAAVQLSVTAQPAAGGVGGGVEKKSGGGGRLEWLALAMLGLLAGVRVRKPRSRNADLALEEALKLARSR